MKFKDYVKIAKFGDIVEFACPGHLQFVLAIHNYEGVEPSVTCMWVERDEDGGWKAMEYWAHKVILSDVFDVKIINKNSNNKKMKITNLVKKILDADTRKLVKAGFINGDLALTDEGVSELLGILFLEKKDELVKIADEKITNENNN